MKAGLKQWGEKLAMAHARCNSREQEDWSRVGGTKFVKKVGVMIAIVRSMLKHKLKHNLAAGNEAASRS